MAAPPLHRIADRLPTLEEWQRILKFLEGQEEQIKRLRKRNEELERQLGEALRAAKRQAAPFRKPPKKNPRKPGRKAGAGYGQAHCRAKPQPEQVQETLRAALPEQCPHCGGTVQVEKVAEQYQTELPPVSVIQRRFQVELGHCQKCGKHLQGRHPEQTSDALGVAGATLGSRAIALAAYLDITLGLSHDKQRELLAYFGLQVSRSGLCQAIARTAQKAEPTYQHLIEVVRRSPQVTADETGWRVGGRGWWLWALATPLVTVYAILPGRGFAQAASVLGEEYAGRLVHDGWIVYEQFQKALHQTCLAHLLRRCREMIEVASPWNARFPLEVKQILQGSLQLRERWEQGLLRPHGLAVARGLLRHRLERAWWPNFRCSANERLANHLFANSHALFTFLEHPGTDATNWRAEQALRPLVVTRKVWGGNRTENGSRTQAVLGSVLRTCWQQQRSGIEVLRQIVCFRHPQPLPLLSGDLSPPAPTRPT
ncbi:MAG: IS66 family transposase [Terriglobales bacterium]